MPPLTAELRRTRARLAARTRYATNAADLEADRRAFRAARLEEHVRDAVSRGLTDDQRRRVADVLLAPSPAGRGASE